MKILVRKIIVRLMDWLYGSRAGSGKQDDFLLCFYEKISSRLLGQFCCFDSC